MWLNFRMNDNGKNLMQNTVMNNTIHYRWVLLGLFSFSHFPINPDCCTLWCPIVIVEGQNYEPLQDKQHCKLFWQNFFETLQHKKG